MIEAPRQNLLTSLRRLLGRARRRLFPRPPTFHTEAYSQEGEDLILQRIFADKPNGFYVDVGAHHPMRFSNTFLFYKRGWSGLNIDAMPGSMAPFRSLRPRDHNIEAAIGQDSGTTRTFWVFNEPALNTFDEALARSKEGGPHGHAIVGKHEVPIRSLRDLFAQYLPANTAIDFLTVDVEGLDLEVLQSNDWERHRPGYVLAECTGVPLADLDEDPVYRFLAGKGYELFAKTINTAVFRRRDEPAHGTTPSSP